VYPAWSDGSWDPEDFALLTVFVYGFNNDPGDEWDRWSKKTWPGIKPLITPHSNSGIPGQHGVILFSWPGDSNNLADAFGPLLYPSKIRPAIESGVELAKYLKGIAPCNKGLRVQFVGHSLGCRVVLSAVEELARKPQEVRVVRVLLMGAAVPVGDCTEQGPWPTRVRDLFSAPKGYEFAAGSDIILRSRNDDILGLQFSAGELAAAKLQGVKSHSFPRAVGRTGGPYPKRWTGVVDSCGLKHSQYLTDPTAVMHVANLFGTLAYRLLPGRLADTRPLDEQRMGSRPLASAQRTG
jgi:pimeloyl-ACP methyl ester carboxylesterase